MFSDDGPETIVDLLLSTVRTGLSIPMGLRQVPLPAKLLTLPCVLANCESLHDPVASYIPDDEQGQYTAVQALLAARLPPSAVPASPGESSGDRPAAVRGWNAPAGRRGC